VSFEAKVGEKDIKKLYEQVRAQIEKVSEQYKSKAEKNHTYLEFNPGDLIWIHLRKKRFPLRRKKIRLWQ